MPWDQLIGKSDLLGRDVVAPFATPVDRRDEQILLLLLGPHLGEEAAGGVQRNVSKDIYARTIGGGAPLPWDVAANRAEG